MFILNYIWKVIQQTGMLLVCGLFPYMIFALITHFISTSIRKRLFCILGNNGYVWITAPGVVIHELSHAFFCVIFRHKITDIKLFSPEADGTLGYVKHEYNLNSRFQRCGNFFIGTGPVWGGFLVLYLLSLLLLSKECSLSNPKQYISIFFSFAFWRRWQTWIWLYLFMTISSHITLSPPDLAGAAEGFFSLLFSVLLFELFFAWSENLYIWSREKLLLILENIFPMMTGFVIVNILFTLCLIILVRGSCEQK